MDTTKSPIGVQNISKGITMTVSGSYSSTSSSTFLTTPIVSNASLYTSSNDFSTTHPTTTNTINGCLWILYEDIGTSKVRIWDVMMFVPNVLVFLFVIFRMRRFWHRILSGIGSGGSPIFITYFVLVALAAFLGVVRGIVSMTVDVASLSGSDANKILWVILRFFLLVVELSVLVFGIAFGHLDSKASVKRVLLVTTSFAFIYSAIQCTLELILKDEHFSIDDSKRSVYGHGGPLFCFITSCLFLIMYIGVLTIPFIKPIQKYLSVPTRKSFYIYILFMVLIYFTSTVGCAILLLDNAVGYCLLDVYSIAYFTMFAPLIYWTFLSSFFSNTQPTSMLFSYATHVDEGLADVADYDYPGNGVTVDSTLSGILVFNQGPSEVAQQPASRPFRAPSTDGSSATSPSSDSTHSFIHGPR